jgi:hypothetical protein
MKNFLDKEFKNIILSEKNIDKEAEILTDIHFVNAKIRDNIIQNSLDKNELQKGQYRLLC